MMPQAKEFNSNRLRTDSTDPLKVQFIAEYRNIVERLSHDKANLNQISTTKAESSDHCRSLQQKIAMLEATAAQYEQLLLKSW